MPNRRQPMQFLIRHGQIPLRERTRTRRHPMRIEQRPMQEFPIVGQGTQHQAIHEHPSHERGRGAFVESCDAFFLDRLHEALERA